jgi:hypothetical protein
MTPAERGFRRGEGSGADPHTSIMMGGTYWENVRKTFT